MFVVVCFVCLKAKLIKKRKGILREREGNVSEKLLFVIEYVCKCVFMC